MSIRLTEQAKEGSTFIVNVTFRDEDENLVTPNSGSTWSLYTSDGTVVNERTDVDFVEDTSVDIVLSGDDLKPDDDRVLYLLLEGTYNSDAGSNLPFKETVIFEVEDLVGVV